MAKDDAWWLRTFYILFVLFASFVSWKFVQTIGVNTNWMERYDDWWGTGAFVVSCAMGAAATTFLAGNKDRNEYLLASIGELRKVTWPSMVDTRRMTLIVCIVVGVFAVILAIFDFAWAKVLGLLLS